MSRGTWTSGESSGGVSVCLLNASPKARGLFRRAALSSGPCIVPDSGWGPHSVVYGYNLTKKLLVALNVSSLEDLYELPPQRLQWDNDTLDYDDNFAGYSYDDGGVLSMWPEEAYRAGALNADALLVGHTTKDGTSEFYGTAPMANASAADCPGRWRLTCWKVPSLSFRILTPI